MSDDPHVSDFGKVAGEYLKEKDAMKELTLAQKGVLRARANLAWNDFDERRKGAWDEKAAFLNAVHDALVSAAQIDWNAVCPPEIE